MSKRRFSWSRLFWGVLLCACIASVIWLCVYACMTRGESGALARLSARVRAEESASVAPDGALPAQTSPGTTPSGDTEALPGASSSEGASSDKTAPDSEAPRRAAYRALAEENPDLYGWISIEGTRVDYPVMHTPEEPEKYLHRGFEGRYAFSGLPFMDAACAPEAEAANRIIYGHNMRTGDMFAALLSYKREDFLLAHPYIRFDTLHDEGLYEIMAVLELRAEERSAPSMLCYQPISTLDADALTRLDAYLADYATLRVPSVTPKAGDKLLTLSTCVHAGSDERLIIMARAAG